MLSDDATGPDYYRAVLDRLRADVDRVAAEERDLAGRLAVVRARLGDLRRAADTLDRLLGETSSGGRAPDDGRPTRHADVAERVLRAAGRPLRIPQIADAMVRLGHPLPDDPRIRDGTVYAAVWRRPHVFRKVRRGLYGLAEWPDDGEG
jgi:hypothetical protein